MNLSHYKVPLKQIIKIGISLGLLAFLLHSAGIESTFAELSTANLWFVPLGVGIYLISQLISTYRWKFLCAALDFRLSMRELYDYYLMGMYFSLFLPGSIGGDVGRMYYLAKSTGRRKREALLTLLAERGVGLVALLIMTTTVCLLPETERIPWAVRSGLLTLSSCGVFGFLVLQFVPLERLTQKMPKLELLVQAQVYWKNYPLLAKSVGISLFVHLAMVMVQMMIAHALGIEGIPVLYMAAVYGIVSLVSVLPIFFNGIGAREGTYQLLLTLHGVPAETALAFGIYWFSISLLTSLVGGIVLMKGHYKTPTPEEAETLETDALQEETLFAKS